MARHKQQSGQGLASRSGPRREPLTLVELFIALRQAVNEGDASRVAGLERRIDRLV